MISPLVNRVECRSLALAGPYSPGALAVVVAVALAGIAAVAVAVTPAAAADYYPAVRKH